MDRQTFLAQLEKDRIVEDLISQLKRETLPLILWGCGDVADAVWDYLEKNGIQIDDVYVDMKLTGETFHGKEVKTLEQIQQEYTEYNVILGHSRYELGENLKKNSDKVNKVFRAFSIHYEQYEKVPFSAIEKEADRFVWLCEHLEDEKSIENLLAYLNTKMTGDVAYILDAYKEQMNFYHNDVFNVNDREVFLDIGAYNGDTIKLFLNETDGKYCKIIAVEPDDKNFLELNEYIAEKRMKNVVTSKMGAWNRREDLRFKTGKEQISSVDTNDSILQQSEMITIHAERLDKIFDEEKISFIKINYYEGIVEAITGCEKIICENHPKLAMDVGFDIYKVLELAEYILSLDQEYCIYLRFNRAMSSTFTLYAISKESF